MYGFTFTSCSNFFHKKIPGKAGLTCMALPENFELEKVESLHLPSQLGCGFFLFRFSRLPHPKKKRKWVIFWVVPPPRIPVTTRIITFLVGDPYKPSFATVTGRGTTQVIFFMFSN